MSQIDFYKHLDKDTAMTVTLPMEQIARDCVALNYGAHRLLSALVHELRAKNTKRAEEYAAMYPNEKLSEGEIQPYERSKLADGIEELLNKGLFC
jgi:hypothetical protein